MDPAGGTNGITTTYTYDIASRLTGMASPIASYQFTLDGNGNRINSAETEPLTATPSPASDIYTYNSKKNRLLSAETVNYAYDDEGQLASAGTSSLTFDYDHRLIGISDGSAVSQFSYDAGGNRLRAVRDGVTTRYIYDPYGNLLAEADEQNQITRKYIYGKGLLSLATPSSRFCYHFNATGHTVALTDAAQTVVNSYAYDPFGQILAQQESIPQPFKFVGQYGVMAEPNGLYYMRARYYDPSVGRFISEDPLGFGGGDVNLSAYARNNPISLIDPWGNIPGQPYRTIVMAGFDAISDINEKSIEDKIEYAGLIYKTGDLFYYTNPYPGLAGQSNPLNALGEVPLDSKVVGGYHTHGNFLQTSDESFYCDDYDSADRLANINNFYETRLGTYGSYYSFLGTPLGKIWLYISERGKARSSPLRLR